MDIQEQQMIKQIATKMAELLIGLPAVQAVLFARVPHTNDGPPYYTGPECRLFVIVDDELAAEYAKRVREPHSINLVDGDDATTWPTTRPETRQEAAFTLLGREERPFYESIDWTFGLTVTDVLLDGPIDILLLPKGWTLPTDRSLPFLRKEIGGQEEAHIRATYEVFDRHRLAFVSPR